MDQNGHIISNLIKKFYRTESEDDHQNIRGIKSCKVLVPSLPKIIFKGTELYDAIYWLTLKMADYFLDMQR